MAKPTILHRRLADDPMTKLFKEAKRNRPGLIGIYEFDYEEGRSEPSVADLMIAAGINGYIHAETGLTPEDAYKPGQGTLGGMTVPVQNKYGEIKTIIFIRYNKSAPPSGVDMVNKMTMAHELQHSDDYDSGAIKVGQADVLKSEYDAHQAALKMGFANADREAVGFYLAGLHSIVARGGKLAEAAQLMIDSEQYPRYLKFAHIYFEKWQKLQVPPSDAETKINSDPSA